MYGTDIFWKFKYYFQCDTYSNNIIWIRTSMSVSLPAFSTVSEDFLARLSKTRHPRLFFSIRWFFSIRIGCFMYVVHVFLFSFFRGKRIPICWGFVCFFWSFDMLARTSALQIVFRVFRVSWYISYQKRGPLTYGYLIQQKIEFFFTSVFMRKGSSFRDRMITAIPTIPLEYIQNE